MAIPNVSITVKNGGLGIAAANSAGIQAKVGRISAAEFGDIASENQLAVNTPTQFGSADSIIAACGTGALAQAAILALQEGGGPVVICRAADTAGDVTFLTAVAAAVDALRESSLDFEIVHVVSDVSSTEGQASDPLDASDAATLVSSLATKGAAFWSAHRYDSSFFVIEVEDDSTSGAYDNLGASDYVAVVRGLVTSTNPITGTKQKNPLAWHATARASAVELGRDLAATADGPLVGVSSTDHDEAAHGGACDTANVTTSRTFPRHAGVYLTNARMLKASGSDFEFWQHRRVMNAACAAADDALFTLLSSSVQVDTATGHITESAATAIEAVCKSAINDRVGKYVSGTSVTVDRTTNILSTKSISIAVSIVPLGYLKAITVEIGFSNPAISEAA